MWKNDLLIRFLRGARRLNSPRPPSLPSWDLALVLRALQSALFEPLQSVELKFLSLKTPLLTVLASIKRPLEGLRKEDPLGFTIYFTT